MRGSPPVLRPEEMYPAGVSDVQAHTLETHAGLRMRVAMCGAESAPPMLLLHGWGCSLYAMRFMYAPLARAGFRAIGIDMQGHGLSDKPCDRTQYTLDAMTRNVFAVADALRLDSFDVLGHSMGGRIAAELALRAPERVKRLVLVNAVGFGAMPHVSYALPIANSVIARLLPAPIPSRLVEQTIAAAYGRTRSYTARDVEEYRAPTQFRAFIRASVHLLRRFEWRTLPANERALLRDRSILVTGALDRVVQTVRRGEDRRLVAEGWRVTVVPNVAHVVHEEKPDAVMDALLGRTHSAR